MKHSIITAKSGQKCLVLPIDDNYLTAIEKFGHKAVLSQKQHYLDKQETLIKQSWQIGRNSGLMGTHTNATEFYNNLIQEENESNRQD